MHWTALQKKNLIDICFKKSGILCGLKNIASSVKTKKSSDYRGKKTHRRIHIKSNANNSKQQQQISRKKMVIK